MAYLSAKDERQRTQQPIYKKPEEYSWEEGFDATVGLIFDENLSISSALNRGMYHDRAKKVKSMLNSGELSKDVYDKYADGVDAYDFDGLANELQNPEIKRNYELVNERNEMLKQRRDYSIDVQSKAPTSSTIAGGLTATVLDPINASTMMVSTPFVVAKNLGVLAKTLRATAGGAVIGAGTETLIQPFVFAHKRAIDSPYSVGEAIEQIAYAAAGGGIITGAGHSIAGMLRKVKGDVEMVAKERDLTHEELSAVDSVDSMIRDLDDLEPLDLDKVKSDLIIEAKAEATAKLGKKLDDVKLEKMVNELSDLEKMVKAADFDKASNKKVWDKYEKVRNTLAKDSAITQAEKDLKLLEKGELPEAHANKIYELQKERLELEKKHLQEIAEKVDYINTKQPEMPLKEKPRVTLKEGMNLDAQLKAVEYDKIMADFNKLENPKMIVSDGDNLQGIDAKEFMVKMDTEKSALDKLRACFIG